MLLSNAQKPIHNTLYVRSLIDVVAQKDDAIVRLQFDAVQQRIEGGQMAVDITNCEKSHQYSVSVMTASSQPPLEFDESLAGGMSVVPLW